MTDETLTTDEGASISADGVDESGATVEPLTQDNVEEHIEDHEEGPTEDQPRGTPPPRRGRTALLVSVVMVVLVAAIVAVLATRQPATDRRAASPLVGNAAPSLMGETLDGGAFNIDQHRGRWVVVNYFATWCVPCRVEHPELVAFDRAHGGSAGAADDAVLVSVLYDDDTDTAARFFADHGGSWPVVIDRDARIATDWGVAGVPETYLVRPDGRVAVKLIGGVTQDGMERVIAEVEAVSAEAGSAPAGGGSEP